MAEGRVSRGDIPKGLQAILDAPECADPDCDAMNALHCHVERPADDPRCPDVVSERFRSGVNHAVWRLCNG